MVVVIILGARDQLFQGFGSIFREVEVFDEPDFSCLGKSLDQYKRSQGNSTSHKKLRSKGNAYTHTDDSSCQKNHFNEDFFKNRRERIEKCRYFLTGDDKSN